MSSRIKKIMIILIILIVFIVAILIINKMINKRNIIHETEVPEGAYDFNPTLIKRVKSRNDYMLVEQCIRKYYSKYFNSGDLIAKDYISLYNMAINTANLQDYNLLNYSLDITNMYIIEVGVGINFYYVEGTAIETKEIKLNEFKLGVITDSANHTFGIIPETVLEKIGCINLNEKSKVQLKETNEIVNTGKNTVKFESINDEKYVSYLFKNYINRCIFNTQLAYDSIEDEYKKEKFGNIEEYKKYLLNDKEKYNLYYLRNYNYNENYEDYNTEIASIDNLTVSSYKKTTNKDYTQYVCIDNYGKYYIFRETNTMQYKVILDTYTIDLPEFIEKYENSDSKGKVELNINKIVEALNNKDYEYVYKKLADSFKENYFKSLESFIEYAKITFGEGNKAEYNKFAKTNDYFTYEITLKNKTSKITKTIIMQLLDGTNFVMSFNIN